MSKYLNGENMYLMIMTIKLIIFAIENESRRIDVITLTLAKIYKGKLDIDKIKISDADYQMVKKNLFKTQIRVITLNELLEIELDKDFIKRFIFSQV